MARRFIEYMPLDDVARAPRNPKGHATEDIEASFKRFGFVEPITMDDRTGRLVSGHGRLDELTRARDAGETPPDGIDVDEDGAWLAPVVRGWDSRSDDDADAYLVAANFIGEKGGWDQPGLADLLVDLRSRDSLVGTGYDADRLDNLLASLRRREPDPPDPDVDGEPVEPVTQPGDVWQLGVHRIMCGDAANPEHVAQLLDGEPIEFVFTSPPYNVGIDYDGHDDEQVEWADYEPLLRGVVSTFMAHLAKGRAVAWNTGVSPKTHHFRQALLIESLGLDFYREVVWQKVGVSVPLWHFTTDDPRVRQFTPNYQHELVLLYTLGEMVRGGPAIIDGLLEHDVFKMAQSMATADLPTDPTQKRTGTQGNLRRRSRKVHPAPFPIALPRAFVGHFADRDGIVFDPFMGSGSTLLAAHALGRRGYGTELSPRYVDVICARWQAVTGEKPVRLADGVPVDFAPA